jgi:hypothetical protein
MKKYGKDEVDRKEGSWSIDYHVKTFEVITFLSTVLEELCTLKLLSLGKIIGRASDWINTCHKVGYSFLFGMYLVDFLMEIDL